MKWLLWAILLTGLASTAAHGEQNPSTEFERSNAIEISQGAIGNQVGNHHFFTSLGQRVSLNEYRGKPLVISLIYTSCYHICPTTTQHLDKVVRKAYSVLGKDTFNVVSIGFDTVNDTADSMRIFAHQQGIDAENWTFLSTDKQTIASLAKDIGFQFFPSPRGFDHLLQSTILDANGVVRRQVYGMQFDTPHMIEPLKQLLFGEKPSQSLFQQISNKIRLFCTVYDPYSDTYRFDYSIFVGLFIGLSMGGLMLFLFAKEWRFSKVTEKNLSKKKVGP